MATKGQKPFYDKEAVLENLDFKHYYESQTGLSLGSISQEGWTKKNFLCVFHEEKTGSLGFNLKTGAYKCHGCGAQGDVFRFQMEKYGQQFEEAIKALAEQSGTPSNARSRSINETFKHPKLGIPSMKYKYTDASGKILFYVCRFQKSATEKEFRPCNSKGMWGIKGIDRVPYNLQNIIDADTVHITEGEKDADTLNQNGFLATCKANCTGDWNRAFAEKFFSGKEIIIFQDNDEAGKEKGGKALSALLPVARRVKRLKPLGDTEKYDVTDWFRDGGTGRDLQMFIEDSPWETAEGPTENDDVFAKVICEMNLKHGVIMVGGKCCILNETIDPETGRPDFTLSSPHDFKNFYANKKIPAPDNPGKMISAAQYWFEHPDRREYLGFVFNGSGNAPDGYYNLFRGFAVAPCKGDWALLQNHVFKVLASEKEEIYFWILAWFARILQHPCGERPGTSIVFRGKQGTGKGIFVNVFKEILGPHFYAIHHTKKLVGNFNSHLKDVLLAFADEAFWAGDKQAEGVLKAIITEPFVSIEHKGKDAIQIKNHINVCIASNNDWVVPAGLEERRHAVFDVSDCRMGDKAYFKAIADQMKNGGTEAMMYDLVRMDISAVDLRTIPRTQGLFEQILNSMDPVQKYWFERLKEGSLLQRNESEPETYPDCNFSDSWPEYVLCEDQYFDYKIFTEELNGGRFRQSREQFAIALKKVCPTLEKRRIRKGSERIYVRYYPGLDACRSHFEEVIKMTVNWDDSLC